MAYDGTASIVKMIHSFITKDLISLRDVFEYIFCSWLLVLVWMILESQSPETEVSAISWAVSGAATCTPFWSHPRRLQDQVPRAGNSPSGQTLLKQHPLKHYNIHTFTISSLFHVWFTSPFTLIPPPPSRGGVERLTGCWLMLGVTPLCLCHRWPDHEPELVPSVWALLLECLALLCSVTSRLPSLWQLTVMSPGGSGGKNHAVSSTSHPRVESVLSANCKLTKPVGPPLARPRPLMTILGWTLVLLLLSAKGQSEPGPCLSQPIRY